MTAAVFLRNHVCEAATHYAVTVVANGNAADVFGSDEVPAAFASMPIERPISPLKDMRALWRLVRFFRRERFDIVHSVSPKAGLLAMLAARIAGVPHRVHTFTGQVWVTRSGLRRRALKQIDTLLGMLTTRPLIDSPSQRDFLWAEGVLPRGKGEVIGLGSICGVDDRRFRPDPIARREVRAEVGVGDTAVLVLFLGRINRDKGVLDLGEAFRRLSDRHPRVNLLLVGPDEDGLAARIGALTTADRCRHVGHTDAPQRYLAAADVLCLPSYREGFGMVVIEAAAVGVPAVASRIYGISDAVVDGETGILHAPGDIAGLASALERLVVDAQLRQSMGAAARARALRDFSVAGNTAALMAFYGKILG